MTVAVHTCDLYLHTCDEAVHSGNLYFHTCDDNVVSLRDNIVAQKASTMSSSDPPYSPDHFHLLLSIVVMYN
jgi:hypothetical protein